LTLVAFQVADLLPGSVEVKTLPALSAAAQNELDGQEMPSSSLVAVYPVVVHVAATPSPGSVVLSTLDIPPVAMQNDGVAKQATVSPPVRTALSAQVGLASEGFDVKTLPFRSMAAHSVEDAQETSGISSEVIVALCQVALPPLDASEETAACPFSPTAAQALTAPQDTERKPLPTVDPTSCAVQVAVPADFGSVDVHTALMPLLSEPAATHSDVVGQETAPGPSVPKALTVLATHFAFAPLLGSVEVSVTWLPAPRPIATHRLEDGHETPSRSTPRSSLLTVHAGMPSVGELELRTFPFESTATQSVAEGQEIALIVGSAGTVG
jgi:hypothetical protein